MADFFEDQNNMEEDDDIITLYNEATDKDEDFYHLATLRRRQMVHRYETR